VGRRLGQHFLTDPGILDRIVEALDPSQSDVVIEIGAGKGTLTRRLASRVGTVIAIEKDPKLAAALRGSGRGERGTVLPGNIVVVEGDALGADWHALLTEPTVPPFKVVGNIPYYITTPLIEKALTPPMPVVVVFLVQREVADRLTATPGSKAYGALTAGVQVTARAERLFVVKAGAFRPPPRVDSAVVRLTPLAHPVVRPEEHSGFRGFVTALFGARRKQIGRGLRVVTSAPKDQVDRVLGETGLAGDQRPEVLSPQELVRLWMAARSLTPPGGGV
jgi:16S rRNA (adenine1518-N6/adenine1519-N6)-dimethyltransferase